MAKKPKQTVLPTLDRWGGRQRVVRKAATSELLDDAPDRIAAELMDVGYSSVGEVFDWDEGAGSFRLKAKRDISQGALRSIKRVRVTRRRKVDDNGDTIMDENIEVEFHDKIAALRLMAQASGMLNKEKNTGIPSITGIELKGPAIAASRAQPIQEHRDAADPSQGRCDAGEDVFAAVPAFDGGALFDDALVADGEDEGGAPDVEYSVRGQVIDHG
jgi:hypothetical protein